VYLIVMTILSCRFECFWRSTLQVEGVVVLFCRVCCVVCCNGSICGGGVLAGGGRQHDDYPGGSD
jgi:hypothetical protein